MNYIKVYKNNKTAIRFFIGLGAVLFFLGTGLFVYSTWFVEQGKVTWFTGNYIALAFQGVVAWGVGLYSIGNEKYFVEWDDEIIRWWLPRRKEIETIRIEDIRSVEIQKMQIVLTLEHKQKMLNLKFFFYPERRMIVDKFENIQQSLNA